jgi:hypothetical protein
MRKSIFMAVGLGWLALHSLPAWGAPRGQLVELHSCQVYAGGCIASSEASLGGRYMLRWWDFNGGSASASGFDGLQAAVLEVSRENLATPEARTSDVVIYLPETASAVQREAMLEWLTARQPEFGHLKPHIRVVPMKVTQGDGSVSYTAGEFVSVKVGSMAACPTGGCGERLWYSPRSVTSFFTVAVNRASEVREPLLQLKWSDGGKPSAFVGRFGEATPAKNQYVNRGEFCGTSGTWF